MSRVHPNVLPEHPKDKVIRISAGEVNKYIYCPYQWYYLRIYGEKNIRSMYRDKRQVINVTKVFKKGNDFHRRFGRYERLVPRIIVLAAAALLLGLLIIWRYLL